MPSGIFRVCLLDAADKDVLKQVQRRAVNKISGLSGRTYVDKLKELELEQKNLYRHAANILSMVLMMYQVQILGLI